MAKKSRPKRLLIQIHDLGLLDRIEAYRTEVRRPSQSNAVEALIAEALDARDAKRNAG